MIDRLNIFALEVGKVCLEVGKNGELTERDRVRGSGLKLILMGLIGNLGVTAHVTDIDGTWQDLTKHVNRMALNLTGTCLDLFIYELKPDPCIYF